jgi:hypothetical protein
MRAWECLAVWSWKFWESRGSRKTSGSARAHLINRPPSHPHLRFAHECHGTQLATPSLLACALSRMRKLSPVASHRCNYRGSDFRPLRLPPPRPLPPDAVTGRGLLRRHETSLRVRRLQQSVQCSRRAHHSCVANFFPGLVRYHFEGPSRRSLFRHACTRPPPGRAFTTRCRTSEFGLQQHTPPGCKSKERQHTNASCCAMVAVLLDCDPAGMLLAGQYEPYETHITQQSDWPSV